VENKRDRLPTVGRVNKNMIGNGILSGSRFLVKQKKTTHWVSRPIYCSQLTNYFLFPSLLRIKKDTVSLKEIVSGLFSNMGPAGFKSEGEYLSPIDQSRR
jgi:hypothetical protein